MNRIPLALSVLGLVLSLLAFVASFLNLSWPLGSWVLMLGAMALFGPILAKYPRTNAPSTILEHRAAWGRFFRSRPRWLLWLTVAAGANAVLQVIAYIILIPWGSASQWNGRYVLHDRSRIIRELTELEYHRVLALDSRVGMAILMAVFCFLVRWNWQTTEE
jgi:hypothetical protein